MKNLSIKPTMIVLFTASVLFLTSCSKKGPEGPQGTQGNAGAPGPVGSPGTKGDPGTANVIYSAWTAFNGANWQAAVNEYGKSVRYYPITATAITNDVLNNGVVLIYMRVTGNGIGPTLLPQTFYGFTQFVNQYIGFNLSTSQIKIKFFNIDNNNDPGTFGSFVEYRYVIIPGGVTTTTSASIKDQSQQPDCKDYNAVKAYFNLPE